MLLLMSHGDNFFSGRLGRGCLACRELRYSPLDDLSGFAFYARQTGLPAFGVMGIVLQCLAELLEGSRSLTSRHSGSTHISESRWEE